MSTNSCNPIHLPAHIDGDVIRLDEPYDLPPGAQLFVTVIPTTSEPTGINGWKELSAAGLSRAYSDDEPEYTESDTLP